MKNEIEKCPSSTVQVRFQDCDPLSHLNNAKYLDYFMNAREDHLKEYYDLDIYHKLKEKGESWVVAKSEIVYRKPAFLMELVTINSQVKNFSLKHVEVEMAMYDESGTKLKSLMRTVFIPFNVHSQKVVEHDNYLMDLLKSVRVSDISENIEERTAQLEGKLTMN